MNRLVVTLALVLLLIAQINAAPRAQTHRRILRRAPEIFTAIRSDCAVELSWHSSSDSLCLERRSSHDELFSALSTIAPRQTRFLDTTLTPNDTVWYRLRPVAARYITEFSAEVPVTVSLPSPRPPSLVRIAVDSVRVTVDSLSSLAQRVLIERKIGGLFQPVGHTTRTQRSFTDGGVKAGVYHYYRLRYEGSHFTGPPSRTDSILLDLTPPNNMTIASLNDHSVIVSWQPSLPYACAYDVEKRSSAGIQVFSTEAGATHWTDPALRYDQRSYYRVRTVSGNDTSDYTTPLSAYYVLKPVSEFRADPIHDPVVHLSWADADSLTSSYVVERSSDSLHFSQIARLGGHVFAYVDSVNARGKTFYYRITSVASNGVSVVSEVIAEKIRALDAGMVLVADTAAGGSFYCDALEMSAMLYADFCRETGRDLPEDPSFPGHPDYWSGNNGLPAVNVSWNDAIAFCNWRSVSVGLQPAYDAFARIIPNANGYRLPDRAHFLQALHSVADTTANLLDNNSGFGQPVLPVATDWRRTFVYNLIGNVWEWTNDSIADGGRIILGGAYCTTRKLSGEIPEFCYRADYTSPTIGFRCILPANRP